MSAGTRSADGTTNTPWLTKQVANALSGHIRSRAATAPLISSCAPSSISGTSQEPSRPTTGRSSRTPERPTEPTRWIGSAGTTASGISSSSREHQDITARWSEATGTTTSDSIRPCGSTTSRISKPRWQNISTAPTASPAESWPPRTAKPAGWLPSKSAKTSSPPLTQKNFSDFPNFFVTRDWQTYIWK